MPASSMPSASAWSRSASKRAVVSFGTILPPPASTSRYSSTTRESNRVEPSSRISTGILPSGFCCGSGSLSSWVEASSTLILPSKPSTLAAMRALRPNGDPKLVRKVTMGNATLFGRPHDRGCGGVSGRQPRPAGTRPRGEQPGVARVSGVGAFAFLAGIDIEGDPLPCGQRFEPGPFDCGDVNEHIAAAIIGLDEPVAALGIEKLNRTCHCHWEAPNPKAAAGPHGA